MVISVKKGAGKKEIDAAMKRLEKNKKKPTLSDFYGKLKGKFGDGLAFQNDIRNEWD